VIDLAAWAFVLALALVVAAFCGFEIRWKVRRLRDDLRDLDRTIAELRGLSSRLTALTKRAQALTSGGSNRSDGVTRL
jgi:hypothetical protein